MNLAGEKVKLTEKEKTLLKSVEFFVENTSKMKHPGNVLYLNRSDRKTWEKIPQDEKDRACQGKNIQVQFV